MQTIRRIFWLRRNVSFCWTLCESAAGAHSRHHRHRCVLLRAVRQTDHQTRFEQGLGRFCQVERRNYRHRSLGLWCFWWRFRLEIPATSLCDDGFGLADETIGLFRLRRRRVSETISNLGQSARRDEEDGVGHLSDDGRISRFRHPAS